MNAKQIEVHSYYKDLYPNALILYKLPDQYMILGLDVDVAQESIPEIQIVEPGVGLIPDKASMLSALSADGMEVHIVLYRNDAGVLDLPDIAKIKEEQAMDF